LVVAYPRAFAGGNNEAVLHPAICVADRLGHQHVLSISTPHENVFQQLPATRLRVHQSGLFPRQKVEDFGQQNTLFLADLQKKETSILTSTETVGTQRSLPCSVVCPDTGLVAAKDNHAVRLRRHLNSFCGRGNFKKRSIAMAYTINGCWLPNTELQDPHSCSPSTCTLFAPSSIKTFRCLFPNSPAPRIVMVKCGRSAITNTFEWELPNQNCTPVLEKNVFFYGSLYALRQEQQSLDSARQAALNVRAKPFVSLAIGMSALSILLVLLMILYVFYKNHRTATGGARVTRNRHRTDRRGSRRTRSDRQSVGVQAEQSNLGPEAAAANLSIPGGRTCRPRSRHTSQTSESGLNTGFYDSEALLRHDEGVSMAADEEDERRASTRHSSGNAQNEALPPTPTGPPDTPPGQRVFVGTPWLPSYVDATKTGMYCIVKDSRTPPPEYVPNVSHTDLSNGIENDGLSTSWECDSSSATGVQRAHITSSLPDFPQHFDSSQSSSPHCSPGNSAQMDRVGELGFQCLYQWTKLQIITSVANTGGTIVPINSLNVGNHAIIFPGTDIREKYGNR
uniref:CUB domain-containing protein n=2 Tax=Schistocephalus solidus TaxID=70667 RepID=A0A183SZ51_SCHSO